VFFPNQVAGTLNFYYIHFKNNNYKNTFRDTENRVGKEVRENVIEVQWIHIFAAR